MKAEDLYKELGTITESIDKLAVGRPVDGMDGGTWKRIANGLRIAGRYLAAARRQVDGPLPPPSPKPVPRKSPVSLPSQAVPDHTTDELAREKQQPKQKTD